MTKQKINQIVGSIGAFIGSSILFNLGSLWMDKRTQERLDTNYSKLSWCDFGWTHFFDFTLTNLIVCIKS